MGRCIWQSLNWQGSSGWPPSLADVAARKALREAPPQRRGCLLPRPGHWPDVLRVAAGWM
jgi:hypothetical protein